MTTYVLTVRDEAGNARSVPLNGSGQVEVADEALVARAITNSPNAAPPTGQLPIDAELVAFQLTVTDAATQDTTASLPAATTVLGTLVLQAGPLTTSASMPAGSTVLGALTLSASPLAIASNAVDGEQADLGALVHQPAPLSTASSEPPATLVLGTHTLAAVPLSTSTSILNAALDAGSGLLLNAAPLLVTASLAAALRELGALVLLGGTLDATAGAPDGDLEQGPDPSVPKLLRAEPLYVRATLAAAAKHPASGPGTSARTPAEPYAIAFVDSYDEVNAIAFVDDELALEGSP